MAYMRWKADLNQRISLNELPAGVKVIQINAGNRIHQQKFVMHHQMPAVLQAIFG